MSATIVDSLKALITKLGGAIAQEETIVESLKGVYVALGGEDDVQNNNTVVEMLDKITEVAEGGSISDVLVGLIQRDIVSANLPKELKQIGGYAFRGCAKLTDIVIPDGVIGIGDNAFQYCEFLNAVTLPDSLTRISTYAFGNCKRMTNITIPKNVTYIGSYAFQTCSALTGITVKATTPPAIESNTFSGVPSNANIHVPATSVDLYKEAQYWSARSDYISAISD